MEIHAAAAQLRDGFGPLFERSSHDKSRQRRAKLVQKVHERVKARRTPRLIGKNRAARVIRLEVESQTGGSGHE